MRVIAGKFRGRPIQTPRNLPVRPTTDRTREALFNILNNQLDWEQTQVLDLCCGTAAVSLESLSRGAMAVTCVDQDRRCVAAAKRLFRHFGVEAQAKVVQAKVDAFLQRPAQPHGWVFMDPPYALGGQEALIDLILSQGWLAADGLLVVEHDRFRSFEAHPNLDFVRTYGDSSLSFFSP